VTRDVGEAHAGRVATSVLVVVDADQEARAATEAALVRRFGPDFSHDPERRLSY
jgi:hypothetical protein